MTKQYTRARRNLELADGEKYVHAVNLFGLNCSSLLKLFEEKSDIDLKSTSATKKEELYEKVEQQFKEDNNITKQYKAIALKYHPDKRPDKFDGCFKQMSTAKELLDSIVTGEYDNKTKQEATSYYEDQISKYVCDGHNMKPEAENKTHRIFNYCDDPNLDPRSYSEHEYVYLPHTSNDINRVIQQMHPNFDFHTISDPVEQDRFAKLASILDEALDFR